MINFPAIDLFRVIPVKRIDLDAKPQKKNIMIDYPEEK